jgi:hypothetical protein
MGREGAECIHPGQNRAQWRAPANTVMNFRVP